MYLMLHSIKSLVFGTCSLRAKVHWLLSKTELKSVVAQRGEGRKKTAHRNLETLPNICASHQHRHVGVFVPYTFCKLPSRNIHDALCALRPRVRRPARPLLFTISCPRPACSWKREMHWGTWRWMRVHSSTGSGEHSCTLTQCSWDSGPRCAASWEGCDATTGRGREREGLFLRMTVCVSGPRRVSVNARLCFLKVPLWHKCSVHRCACTHICKYTQPSSCVHVGISVPTFLPKGFLCMYRFYCYHVCPQPPRFRLFRGNYLTNRSAAHLICGSSFLCGRPGESSVTLKHLEVLLKAWVTACWVRPTFVHMKCEPIRESYNTPPTDLVKRVSSSHSRWFTGFVLKDDMEMNHAHAPSSGDFLSWWRGPLRSPHTHLLLQILCIYRQQSITAVLFFTWRICCQ